MAIHVRITSGITAAILLCALSGTLCRADSPQDLIKSKGLIALGNTYVLPIEKELADSIPKLIVLKQKVAGETQERNAYEDKIKMAKSAIQQWDLQRRNLFDEYTKATDIDVKNNKVAAINVLESKIKEADTFKTDIESKVNAISSENRESYINMVIDLGTKVDKAEADYKDFAADADVKSAIEAINKTSQIKMHIGPTVSFTGKVAFLKRMRTDVASDVIPIKTEGNVSTVDVTFNGTLTRSMILDTGAGMVCITADLAEQLKIVPGPTAPTLHLVLADGKAVEAKMMILKSVRVGQFTVHDVECAVMPKDLIAAEPLLGGTFLKNFIVKIDPKAHELHLSAVSDPSKKITSATPAKPDAKTP